MLSSHDELNPVIKTAPHQKIFDQFFIFLAPAIVLLACCGLDARRTIAVVAKTKISRADIACRMAIENAYGDTTHTEQAMLVALINDAIEAAIADRHGISVTSEDLTALDAHASMTSKAPEILARIKQVFGRDIKAYERLYLQPKIVNYKLHAWFSRSVDLHKNERSAIERAHRFALSGMPFDAVARACTLTYSVDTFNAARFQTPALPDNQALSDTAKIHPLLKILSLMKTGTIHPDIIEDDFGFMILKLTRRRGPDYLCQSMTIKKIDFDKWFIEQASEIPVRFMDMDLKKRVIEDYPDLWWMKYIK